MPDTYRSDLDETNLRIRARDAAGRPQMAEGRLPESGTETPVSDFFLVHHYAPVEVNAADWSMAVTRPDGSTATLDLPTLKSLPRHEVTALLECAGMSRGFLAEKTPGTQFGHGMVGVARWGGVRLSDLLAHLGIGTDWSCLILHGGDEGTTMPEDMHADFSKGLPPEKALHPDTILAYEMNGADLPWLHGGPARLVVPGWYGVWWVKWPKALRFSQEEGYDGFWQNQRYTFQDASGAQTGMVREGLPRAIIQTPAAGAALKKGSIAVSGLAWAGDAEVVKVEVSTDMGKTWAEATVEPSDGAWIWRRWHASVEAAGPTGLFNIAARTTDARGRVQAWSSAANRLGYGNNDVHNIQVDLQA